MSMGKFSADKMFSKLENADESPLSVIGFVDRDKTKGFVSFSRPPNCGEVLRVPEDAIVRHERLAKVPCGDHHHHLVRLILKRPSSSEGELFHDLLAAHLTHPIFSASQVGNMPPMAAAAGGPQYCYTDANGKQVCVPI
jgi:hypothetical protein